jgi:hypothetical protein
VGDYIKLLSLTVQIGNDAMDAATLDSNFYRERAQLCHKLAGAATAAQPLFARLHLLAKAYEEKAEAAESKLTRAQTAEALRLPNQKNPPNL